MKKIGKALLGSLLALQVKALRKRHDFKVVAVVGSVGKTSTKIAIADTLRAAKRVRWQEGNYNDRLTVPLVFFGLDMPGLFNVFAWTKILILNSLSIGQNYPYDVVVVEAGTDAPGQMKHFRYLRPDVLVISAIAPEHMEYFGNLDTVAKEELIITQAAKQVLVNIDDVPAKYLNGLQYASYGLSGNANYYIGNHQQMGLKGQRAEFFLNGKGSFEATIPMLGEQGAKMAIAAVAAADMLGVPAGSIEAGLATVESFAGRMRMLNGINGSTIIDDTYNASPTATAAALDVLHKIDAPQRIAILGSMNELGEYSAEAHKEVGGHCNPSRIDWIVTIGQDAKNYLAPAARECGCQVKSFANPYDAGEFVKQNLKKGAVVLAKGSQNGVFAEEALKTLLANRVDESKLVRQTKHWLRIKQKQFGIH